MSAGDGDSSMTTCGTNKQIRVERWTDQAADAVSRMHLLAGIDTIFWATTAHPPSSLHERNVRSDELSEAQQVAIMKRQAFRALWLGDYLAADPEHVWLALTPDGHVAGYLVGTLEDPVRNQRFASLSYFTDFESAVRDFPAHLHINLDAAYRNRGIGRRLIDAFAAQVRASGLPGLHVVTGASQRNVRFYTRAGFTEIARTPRGSGDVVFLGRKT